MPVYLFTLHAYGTWWPDNERGYVRKGQGILPPDELKGAQYRRAARHATHPFDAAQQALMVDGARDVCDRRNWRLHHVVVTPTHLHALVSWPDADITWQHVCDTLKRILGWMLAKHDDGPPRQWFSHGGSRKQVRDPDHFGHLMTRYLPGHYRYGQHWSERADPGVATPGYG